MEWNGNLMRFITLFCFVLKELHSTFQRTSAVSLRIAAVCLCFSAYSALSCSPVPLAITWAVEWHPSLWMAPSTTAGGTESRLLGEYPPQWEPEPELSQGGMCFPTLLCPTVLFPSLAWLPRTHDLGHFVANAYFCSSLTLTDQRGWAPRSSIKWPFGENVLMAKLEEPHYLTG